MAVQNQDASRHAARAGAQTKLQKTELQKELEKPKVSVEAEDKARFNEQCFLIDNLEYIGTHNLVISMVERYKNFQMIQDDPVMAQQLMIGKPGIKELFDLTPAQIALLVPKIRIYKVIYKNENDRDPEFKELVFEDHTSPPSIENLMSGRKQRGSEIGLKKFIYKLTGKQPAEGGMAECTLELFFQNISSLLHADAEDATTGAASFRDLITRNKDTVKKQKGQEINKRDFRIQIVVGWAIPPIPLKELGFTNELRRAIEKSSTSLFLHLKNHDLDFREDGSLVVTLSYEGAMEGEMRQSQVDLLRKTAKGQSAQQLREELTKAEKGKTSAAGPTGQGSKIDEAIKFSNWERLKSKFSKSKTRDEILEEMDARGLRNTPEFQRITLWRLESEDKTVRYSRIINSLYKSNKIWFVNVSSDHIRGFTEAQNRLLDKAVNNSTDLTDDERLKIADIATPIKGNKGSLVSRSNLTDADVKKIKRKNYVENRRIGLSGGGWRDVRSFPPIKRVVSGQKLSKTEENIKKSLRVVVAGDKDAETGYIWGETEWARRADGESIRKTNSHVDKYIATSKPAWKEPGKLQLQFFYFGDLLEVAFGLLGTNQYGLPQNQEFKVLLGSFVYVDPRTKKSKTYNLADIPISLNLFITWWLRKVVAPQKEHYYFGEFIRDAFTSLIEPALGSGCFPEMGDIATSISMVLVDPPEGRVKYIQGERSRIEVDQEVAVGTDAASHKLKKEHYLFIYVSSYATDSLKGDIKEDIRRGIYHLPIGSDRGIVKGIKFSKNQQKFLAEARLADLDEKGNSHLSALGARLRDGVYNANVKMVGNNLFKPGVRVFIDTSAMGDGLDPLKKNSWANLLGLGGYYSVVSLEHALAGDDYETDLVCTWQCSGTPDEKKIKPMKKVQNNNPKEKQSARRQITDRKAK